MAVRPATTTAQVGLPVTDVANLALEVAHNVEQDGLTEDVIFKVLQIYISMRKIDDLAWQDIDGTLAAMRIAAEIGEGFGYGRADIAALLQEAFPGEAGYVLDWYMAKREVVDQMLQTVRNYTATIKAQYEAWDAAYAQIEYYRAEIENMLGQQEAYDVLLALGVQETDEWRMMRQLMMQDLILQSTLGSEIVNEKLQRARVLYESIRGEGWIPEE